MQQFTEPQSLLALSLLSYRGFWKPGSDGHQKLAQDIRDGLKDVPALDDEWQLVWGPATYRYLGSIFDSSMMYIVQNRKKPSCFSIIVRGTNPVAFSDWMLGDFLSHRLVPWHYGDTALAPNAQVSLSTALGLKILLSMRSDCDLDLSPETKRFDFLFDRYSSVKYQPEGPGKSAIFTCTPPTQTKSEEKGRKFFHKFTKKLPEYYDTLLAASRHTENLTYTLGNFLPLDEIISIFPLRRNLIKLLDVALDNYANMPVGVLMPDEEKHQQEQKDGVGLLEYLGFVADKYGRDLEITVTGHSKGGALAPVLALFLADTQNNLVQVPDHYRWNPGEDAKISCHAFAGPTPGNRAFANYFNSQLGKSFFRYSNSLDWACFGWISEEFRKTASIYGDHVTPVPGLEELVNEVADDVATLNYAHPGRNYRVWKNLRRVNEQHLIQFEGSINTESKSFMQQWVFQHVDAYMEALGLADSVTFPELIGAEPDD